MSSKYYGKLTHISVKVRFVSCLTYCW